MTSRPCSNTFSSTCGRLLWIETTAGDPQAKLKVPAGKVNYFDSAHKIQEPVRTIILKREPTKLILYNMTVRPQSLFVKLLSTCCRKFLLFLHRSPSGQGARKSVPIWQFSLISSSAHLLLLLRESWSAETKGKRKRRLYLL